MLNAPPMNPSPVFFTTVRLPFLMFPNSQSTLKPGDPAPALKVGKWIKGGPVEKLESGQVYVVEFWATWCEPCRAEMPAIRDIVEHMHDAWNDRGLVKQNQDRLKEYERKATLAWLAFVETHGF